MKRIRQLHLYLGLALAPMLLFFAISGAWQAVDKHRALKDGSYIPPRIIQELSEIHTLQRASTGVKFPKRSRAFAVLSTALGSSVAVLAMLGMVMAFRFARRKWVPASILVVGTLVPVLLLYTAGA